MSLREWITDPKSIVSLLALAAAVASFLVARRNSKTARSQLAIAERQEAGRSPNLSLYLDRAAHHTTATDRFILFYVTIKNQSDNPNGISRADLHVGYRDRDRVARTAIFPATPASSLGSSFAFPAGTLDLPIQLAASGVASGYFAFAIAAKAFIPMTISNYELVLTDTRDRTERVRTAMLQGEVL